MFIMTILSNTKKTRFKLAIFGSVSLLAITITGMIVPDMKDIAETALAGFLTILSSYILSDGYRKSSK